MKNIISPLETLISGSLFLFVLPFDQHYGENLIFLSLLQIAWLITTFVIILVIVFSRNLAKGSNMFGNYSFSVDLTL